MTVSISLKKLWAVYILSKSIILEKSVLVVEVSLKVARSTFFVVIQNYDVKIQAKQKINEI